jgi:iron complex outermembrane receptor protein
VLLLINGHRMNDNVYGEASIGTEFPLDVALIDRVEIVPGPSSSLYGSNAFFAVVNVITRTADNVGGMELSGGVGGLGSYQGRSSYGGVAHGVELLFSGTIYESAGASRLFFPAFNSPLTNNGIAENADGDASKNLFGNLKFGHFTLESLVSTREKNIPTASFGTVFNDSRTKTVDSAGYLDLQYNRTFGRGTDVTLRASYDGSAYHGVYVLPAAPPGTSVLNHDLDRGDWIRFNTDVTRTLWKKHKVTVGAEIQDNLTQDQTNYNTSPYALFLDARRSSKDWAFFAQDEFAVTRKLIFYAGARHDVYDTYGGSTNPRFALIFTPLKPTTFKLIYGQAFRAPNSYELYYQDGFSVEGNTRLRPERIRSTELVWEQELGANFRFTASGFDNRITDLISEGVDRQNGFITFDNSGRVRSRGAGVELAGKTHSGIEGRASYTFERSEDAATGVSLSNSPPQLVKVNVIWPILHRSVSMGIEGLYTDARKTLAGTEANRYMIANFTATSREFGGGFRVAASVYNLFNRKFSDPVGPEILEPALQQNGRDFRIQITRVFHFH